MWLFVFIGVVTVWFFGVFVLFYRICDGLAVFVVLLDGVLFGRDICGVGIIVMERFLLEF